MKAIFAITLVIAAPTSLHAQEVKPDTKLTQRAFAYKMNNMDTIRAFSPRIEIVPGERVQIFPQDGMPCIVPDTKDIAAMPNALLIVKPAQPVPGQIPNAWKKREGEKSVIVK